MVYKALLACAFAALTAVVDVEGHGYVSNPTPRAFTINNHRYRYEPQSDGQFNGECWDAARGQSGRIVATYDEGQVFTTTVVITAFHKGWHEMRLCDDSKGKNNCLSQTGALALTAPRNNNPQQSVLQGLGTRNYQWELPGNFTCDHCTMQWWWRTDNSGNEHFKSCHDVRIVATGPPTPAPPTNPPTNPPPTNPPTNPPPTNPPTNPPRPCLGNWDICSADPQNCCSGNCSGNQCRP